MDRDATCNLKKSWTFAKRSDRSALPSWGEEVQGPAEGPLVGSRGNALVGVEGAKPQGFYT